MKTSYLTAVLTITCLLGLGEAARAQDADKVVVNVPFEFVAGGKTLPSGTYSVSRLSPARSGLVIHSYGDSALLLPIVFDGTSAAQPTLSFEHVGDKYFLNRVETPAGVYTIAIPRAINKVARMKDDVTLSPSGSN
jgi:hypothetical protein